MSGKTLCEKCKFATYKDNVQTGCEAGVYEILKEKEYDIELIESNGKSFFGINNFVCRYIRPTTWEPDLNKEEYLEKLNYDSGIKITAVVYCDIDSYGEIKNSLMQIENQSMKFEKVIIVNSLNNISNFYLLCKVIKEINKKTLWEIKQVKDPEMGEQYAIDIGFESCKSLFITIFKAGKDIPENFVEELNSFNKKMEKFLVLVPENEFGHGLTIQRHVFLMVNGNALVEWHDTKEMMSGILEKIQIIAEDQNADWCIRMLKEVSCLNI